MIDMEFRKRIARLLAEMHGDEILSEQQCARYFGVDLVSWRHIEHSFSAGASMCEFDSDEPQEMPETSPVEDAILAAFADIEISAMPHPDGSITLGMLRAEAGLHSGDDQTHE